MNFDNISIVKYSKSNFVNVTMISFKIDKFYRYEQDIISFEKKRT